MCNHITFGLLNTDYSVSMGFVAVLNLLSCTVKQSHLQIPSIWSRGWLCTPDLITADDLTAVIM